MNQAEAALLCQMRGDSEGFRRDTKTALKYEQKAAYLVSPYTGYEPSRSVLHRSAAALALDLKEWRIAEQLACAALAGNPPDEIATELRDILEQALLRYREEEREIARRTTVMLELMAETERLGLYDDCRS